MREVTREELLAMPVGTVFTWSDGVEEHLDLVLCGDEACDLSDPSAKHDVKYLDHWLAVWEAHEIDAAIAAL